MIGLIGLDHQRARADDRGRLGFASERLRAALVALCAEPAIEEVVILSTCNRTEVYVATPDWPNARERIEAYLAAAYHRGPGAIVAAVPSAHRGPPDGAWQATMGAAAPAEALPVELAGALYVLDGSEAVRHLLRVAAGLESMVVGEAQILGQVREALSEAENVGAIGEDLRAAFTAALKAGKRVRAETELGRSDTSIAALAVRVAREALGGLAGKSALVVGAGRTSQLCAGLLREGGIGRLVLANRSPRSAAELAREVAGEVAALADVADLLDDIQLIISATAAPHAILSAATMARGLGCRRAPLVIVDLAVPPDVEDAVGLLPPVSLYRLDTLRSMDGAARLADSADEHAAAVAHAERIVGEGLRVYQRGQTMRQVVPGISALRGHVDRSEQQELARALAQLEHLSPHDRDVIARLGQRLVDKMFHHLVSRIRSLAEYDEVPPELTMRVLGRLFADPDRPGGVDER